MYNNAHEAQITVQAFRSDFFIVFCFKQNDASRMTSQSCRTLYVSNICQLNHNLTGSLTNGFVSIGDQTLFICNGELHCISPNSEGHSSECIQPGVKALDLFCIDTAVFLVLEQYGTVFAVQSHEDGFDQLCDVVLNGDVYNGDALVNGDLQIIKGSNLLVMIRNDLATIHVIVGLSEERIITEIIASHRFDHTSAFFSTWGMKDSLVIACSGYSADITTICLKRTNTDSEIDWAVVSTATPAVAVGPGTGGNQGNGEQTIEVVTKHEAWITALSRVASGHCEVSASGDCTGTIIVWRLVPLNPRSDSATLRHTAPRGWSVSYESAALESTQTDSLAVDATDQNNIHTHGQGVEVTTSTNDAGGDPSARVRTGSMDAPNHNPNPTTTSNRRRGSSADKTSVNSSRHNHKHRHSSSATTATALQPVRHLLRSTALCEGHAVSCILIDAALNDLWVADVSGAITSAHLSVRSKSLYPTRRFMLFGTLGGPSFLSWTPTDSTEAAAAAEAAAQEGTAEAAAPATVTKPSGNGLLRAFSPACGMLVDVSVSNSIEAVFRVTAPPSVKVEPRLLGENHVGRVTAEEVRVLHAASIDVCAYLPHWNLVAVTSSRTRLIQLWDLYSGLLQCTIQTTEANCKCLAAFDVPVVISASATATTAGGEGTASSTAWLAAGYSTGKFVLYLLQRHNKDVATAAGIEVTATADPVKPATEVIPVGSSKHHKSSRRASRTDSQQSSKRHSGSRKASRVRTSSAQDVDILDAIGPQAGVEYGHIPTEDDLSEASEGSIMYAKDDFLGGSDEDSVGGGMGDAEERASSTTGAGGGGGGGQRRGSNATAGTGNATRRRISNATSGGISSTDYRRASTPGTTSTTSAPEITHTVEISTQFCPLPITDIIFSTSGGFVAIVHIRKVIVVFNNHPDAKKMSLKVSFDEVFCDLRAMVPSELTASWDVDKEAHLPHPLHSYQPQRRNSVEKTLTFKDPAGQRRASFNVPADLPLNSTAAAAALPLEEESLVLLLQSPTRVRLLDGIKGVILTEFALQTDGTSVAACAAWDVPIPVDSVTGNSTINNTSYSIERAIAGLCVAQGMKVFTFGEESGQFRQHFLHDQVPLLAGPMFTTSLHTDSHISPGFLDAGTFQPSASLVSQAAALQQMQLTGSGSRFSALDNLVQGVLVRELTGFSPLACVWSLRRLALLRVQLVNHHGVEVLRSEEYSVSQENVRIVYASALKVMPRMRNHRALVVLSNGHVVVLHI